MGKSIDIAVLAERPLWQGWRHLADPDKVPRPGLLPIFLRDHVEDCSQTAIGGAYAALLARQACAWLRLIPIPIHDVPNETDGFFRMARA